MWDCYHSPLSFITTNAVPVHHVPVPVDHVSSSGAEEAAPLGKQTKIKTVHSNYFRLGTALPIGSPAIIS